jgi:hypothetical protein
MTAIAGMRMLLRKFTSKPQHVRVAPQSSSGAVHSSLSRLAHWQRGDMHCEVTTPCRQAPQYQSLNERTTVARRRSVRPTDAIRPNMLLGGQAMRSEEAQAAVCAGNSARTIAHQSVTLCAARQEGEVRPATFA